MRPRIKKIGTVDCDMVETTPVVWKGRLYRFEYVRPNHWANRTGDSYFRFVDVETGRPSPPFARGFHLGSAYVEGETAYVYGVERWGGDRIFVFRSDDLESWRSQVALETPGWGIYNSSVCKAGDGYVMAVEVGEPPEVVGVRFTIFFAESRDLLSWRMLPPDRVYSRDRYTACPVLRYVDGWFYMIYLEAYPEWHFAPHIVRSKDLKEWEPSPFNPIMWPSEEDKRIANPSLPPQLRERIAGAVDINNSDVDLCEYRGRTVIYYSWGDQRGTEFLAEAVYEGSLESFLKGFFPEGGGKGR
ncbi:hypothetical protein DRP77_02320 [Candidatus Poribacteria bacterium]|nr:MAG: hypothetical protein DRP77_02320 [Candidatus Poribacteria bacterium]